MQLKHDCQAVLDTFGDESIRQQLNWKDVGCCISPWTGIKCKDGNIVEIELSDMQLSGTIDLKNLPKSLKVLNLHGNKFTGHVDMEQLIKLPSLKILDLSFNYNLNGILNVNKLPKSLQKISLNHNKFHGNVDFAKLQQLSSLSNMDLCNNQFKGSVDLRNLPSTMWGLFLEGNNFTTIITDERYKHVYQRQYNPNDHDNYAKHIHFNISSASSVSDSFYLQLTTIVFIMLFFFKYIY